MRPAPAGTSPGRTRVLRVFSRLNIGGPSVHVVLLTAGLKARGYDTRLVVGFESRHEGNLLDFAAERGVGCERMEGLGREIRPVADARAFRALYRLIREYRPHIVHTHTAKAGLLGRLAARAAGVPVVVHTYHGHVLRGYFGPVRTAAYRRIERAVAPMTTALVAVSETVKRELVELGISREEAIRVVPLGLDLERLSQPLPRGGLRRESGVKADAPLIGIVGRLVPIKDAATFLRAAERVRRVMPDARFALIGDGEEREDLERLVGDLGLGESAHFHGWRRDMEAVYGDLDLVVNSSRNEGTPVALIEALAAGRPVVATAVGGTPDLLGAGQRGWLVAPGEPAALAEAMLTALVDREAARRRAQAGQGYVLADHGSGRLFRDVDALYRELLDGRSARAA